MVGLGDLPGGEFGSVAHAISADGTVIVGDAGSALAPHEAFRWDSEEGMVGLGDLPGGNQDSRATDVSRDGSIIVGASDTYRGFQAFRWDEKFGMISVQNLLANRGIDMEGWLLKSAVAVSDDGTRIVGTGYNPDGIEESWLAELPIAPEPQSWVMAAAAVWSMAASRRSRLARRSLLTVRG